MIDTHTHLYLSEFAPSPEEAVKRAESAGVELMVMPNVDLDTIEPMRALHAAMPEKTCMAMGMHPTEVKEKWEADLARIEAELNKHPQDYVAIGEVGIDLYWDQTFRQEQREALAVQASWAKDRGLPLIIHCRDGLDDTLDVLHAADLHTPVIFHSFTGDVNDVKRIREMIVDPWFGINGVVTFKNSRLRETLPEIGIERILTETDAPYLAPVPHRGKRNESAYVIHTLAHIADTLGMSINEADKITTANALKAFNIKEK